MKQTLISKHYTSTKPDPYTLKRKRVPDDSAEGTKKKAPNLPKHQAKPIAKGKLRVKEMLQSLTKVPPLSSSTQELLSTIKPNSENPTKKAEEILNSKPAKDKFASLLSPERGLVLPYSYKRLLAVFEANDSTLNFAKFRRIPCTFENIKAGIEETHKIRYELSQLKQILYVMPSSYQVYWVPKNSLEFQLTLDFPPQLPKVHSQVAKSDLDSRKSDFRNNLITLAKHHHQEFLQTKGLVLNSNNLNSWHPEFDPNSLKTLPEAELPQKPQPKKKIPDVFDTPPKKVPETLQETPKPNTSQIKGLSPFIADQVRARAMDTKIKQMQTLDSQTIANHAYSQKLCALCEVLRALFNSQRTPSIFLKNLLKKLEGNQNLPNSKQVTESYLRDLISMFPDWLVSIQTNSGEVIRMNRQSNFTLSEQKEFILSKYN